MLLLIHIKTLHMGLPEGGMRLDKRDGKEGKEAKNSEQQFVKI